jgi:transposase-like protein
MTKHTLDQKIDAIEQVWTGKTVTEVVEALGVVPSTLYSWIRDLVKKPATLHPRLEKICADYEQRTGCDGRQGPIRSQPAFSDQFKKRVAQEAVNGLPVQAVAEKHGVLPGRIYEWLAFYFPDFRFGAGAAMRDIEEKDTMTEDQDVGNQGNEHQHPVGAGRSAKPKASLALETMADPLVWLQNHTQTKDSHWQEAGARSCYRPFPNKPYFRPLADAFQNEPVLFIEKSRDMMLSWLCVGLFTHAAMTIPGIEVLFQSQKEDKAHELVAYAKTLYQRQEEIIRKAYPLKKGKQPAAILEFAHGSRIVGIPGGGNQIRSYHPWGLFQDEAAFMPQAGESYDHAVPVCQKIVVVSSAGPGWFSEQCQSAADVHSTSIPKGVGFRRMPDGRPVYRVHYSADPERDPEWVARERKKHSSQGSWDREQEIIHEAGGGERLFAEIFSRHADKILIDPYSSGFQPSPHWKKLGGFDHGKANPTGAIVACIDYDGVIYILGEYYQAGLSPAEHRPNLLQLNGFMQAEVYADPSIFYKTQAQEGGKFKAIAELYADVGITNLLPAPENHELLGMERILAHWHDLDNREPTLKIVCPREKRDISRPIYGIHNDGCPNLLWELRRTRREELSATQLVVRNPTERIVDKDNHLRDPLKYLCLALPAPTEKTEEIKARQAMALIPPEDVTSRMIHFGHAFLAQEKKEPVIGLGRRGLWLARRRRR